MIREYKKVVRECKAELKNCSPDDLGIPAIQGNNAMPQTMKEKRMGAIARYKSAVALHTRELESAEFRLREYLAKIDTNPLTVKKNIDVELVEAVKETIAYEKSNIANLMAHIAQTSRACAHGGG
jgi:hypothetical protein